MAKKKQEKYSIRKNYTLGPLDMRPAANARNNSAFATAQANVYRGNSDALLVRPGRELVLSDIAPSGSVGPKNGIFTLGNEIIFAEDASLYKLSPVGITAAYTITPPVTALLEERFATGAFATWWTDPYYDPAVYTPTELTVVPGPYRPPEDPSGARYSANYYVPAGALSDLEPIKLQLYPNATSSKDIYTLLGSLREIHVSWSEWFLDPYPWPVTSQKMIQIGYFNANELIGVRPTPPPGSPASWENWEVMLTIHGDGATGNLWHQADFSNANAVGTFWTLTDNNPTGSGRGTDRWVRNEVHLKLNSAAGVTDGFLRWYEDGVNVLTKVDSPYLWPGDINAIPLADTGVVTHAINSISIGLNWSNPSGVAPFDGHRYIDAISISGS